MYNTFNPYTRKLLKQTQIVIVIAILEVKKKRFLHVGLPLYYISSNTMHYNNNNNNNKLHLYRAFSKGYKAQKKNITTTKKKKQRNRVENN